MSRIAPLVDDLLGTEDADDIMIEIMDVLSDSIAPVSYTHLTLPTK